MFLLSPAALADEASTRRMTLADVVREATRRNPDVRSSEDDQRVARAERWEVGGNFGPRLHVDASLQGWNSGYDLNFQLDPSQPAVPFHVRDAFTWNFSASAIQPLTGLFVIFEQYRVRDIGVDVAALRSEATRRDVGFRAIEGYYRVLETERLAEVANTSVDQLTAQLKQANSFHDSGVVSRDDVLRAELALASAKQRVIQTRAQVSLARSRLAVVMGMPASSDIDAVPLEGEPDVRNDATLERAESRALTERIEVRQIVREIDQSKRGVRVAWYKLAPQINLVGNYQHNEGSPFNQTNAAYIGGTLSWDVWDWGSTIAGIHVANARLDQKHTMQEKIEDQLRLEVREAFLNVGSAIEALQVAKAAVTSAEEHYRLVNKRYEANTTTSFDVVDAESLLTQARAQLQTSTYDYLIARAALKRAMGESPEQQQH